MLARKGNENNTFGPYVSEIEQEEYIMVALSPIQFIIQSILKLEFEPC